MSTLFRQHVGIEAPAGSLDVARQVVREHLSRVTHPDDGTAYADEVVLEQVGADDGGMWVLGAIDRDPTPRDYSDGGEPTGEQVIDREGTDYDGPNAAAYRAHLAEKAAR